MSGQRGERGASKRKKKAAGFPLEREPGNPGLLDWRRNPLAADPPEPDWERGQIHGGGVGHSRSERRVIRWMPSGAAVRRSRHRDRHTHGEAAADLRTLDRKSTRLT